MVGPHVSILVKTALVGLEALHEESVSMEIDLSWEAAFLKYFKVNLDKVRYSVKRGVPSAPKHFLSESIRIWLDEFQQVRAKYVVHIVENSRKSQAKFCTPASPKRRGRPRKVKSPEKRGPSTEPSNLTATLPRRVGIASTSKIVTEQRQQNGKRREEQPQSGPEQASSSRYQEDDPMNDGDNENGDGPDWETGTQYSQDSQSSQEDLAALGIKREDLKAVFIKKAMDKFSNAQLLIGRQALRDMKDAKHNNRWIKWINMCPIPINILRELYDV